MEVSIVGWHTQDAPYSCNDCGEHADVMVEMEDEGFPISFNLCKPCVGTDRYKILKDKVSDVFTNLGL